MSVSDINKGASGVNPTAASTGALPITGGILTGDLGFSGNGRRITGDFSNNTRENRLSFETSTTNGNTLVQAIPNGTATISGFIAYGGSDADNAAYLQVHAEDNSHVGLNSSKSGTGTTQDLVLQINGVTKAEINASDGSFQYSQGVNAQTGTTYTLAATDYAKLITINNASTVTITLPQQSTLTTTNGFWCKVRNLGAGSITFVKEGAETIDGNTTLIQYGEALIERPTTTKWSIAYATATIIEQETVCILGTLTNDKVYDVFSAPDNITIVGFSLRNTSVGTAGTYTAKIDGTNITGLAAIANSATRTNTAPTALNTMTYQQVLSYVPTGTTSVVDAFISVFYTRNY